MANTTHNLVTMVGKPADIEPIKALAEATQHDAWASFGTRELCDLTYSVDSDGKLAQLKFFAIGRNSSVRDKIANLSQQYPSVHCFFVYSDFMCAESFVECIQDYKILYKHPLPVLGPYHCSLCGRELEDDYWEKHPPVENANSQAANITSQNGNGK
ncbi:MAG: hypothetical protein P4L33_02610 [Capsulimonadaceae bacterium]|nr:hypothetical protein [Capsulimonadaceae bacterium]